MFVDDVSISSEQSLGDGLHDLQKGARERSRLARKEGLRFERVFGVIQTQVEVFSCRNVCRLFVPDAIPPANRSVSPTLKKDRCFLLTEALLKEGAHHTQ